MHATPATALRLFLATCTLSGPLLAGDWYVDGINGNNANGGTSSSDAWRTITWAQSHVPAGEQTIHVASGVYSTLIGETFPITLRPEMQLVGAGVGLTTIDGGGNASALIRASSLVSGDGWAIPSNTLVERMTLQNADFGIEIVSNWNLVEPTFRDLEIRDSLDSGVRVSTFTTIGGGAAMPTFERVSISSDAPNGRGFNYSLSGSGPNQPVALDCSVVGNGASGATIVGGATSFPTFRRCRFEQNDGHGVSATFFNLGSVNLILEDCLIARNQANGVQGTSTTGLGGGVSAQLSRCTVAHNGNIGVLVSASASGGQNNSAALLDTIVFGNADDVHLEFATATAARCDVGDGDFAGQNGNFSADPLFVNAAGGDMRLRFGSPCIGVADRSTPPGTLDLAGYARPIDGDLDAVESYDIGCFEFAPLSLFTTGELGTPLKLELWGPQGNATTVYFARSLIVGAQATPFGEFDLAPNFAVYRVTTVGAGPPKTITRPIPNDIDLIGLPFSFQALTDSAAAPQGKAYTNAVELTIVP